MPSRAVLSASRLIACTLALAASGLAFGAPAGKPASAPIEPPGTTGAGGGGAGGPQVYISDNPDAPPSIVMRDKDGKFIPVDMLSPEERAFRVFAYTEEQWARLDTVIDQRNREIDAIALREFDKVIEARKLMFELDKYDTVESMQPLRELGRTLSPTAQTSPPQPGGLVDRLIAEGALEPEKRDQIKPVVDEYAKVLREYWLEQAGGDENKVAVMAEKDAFANDVRDAVQSIDRQVRVALPDFVPLARRCGLTSEQAAELKDVEKVFAEHPGNQAQQIVQRLQRAKAFFYGTMTVDQAHKFTKLAEARRRMFEKAGRGTEAEHTPSSTPGGGGSGGSGGDGSR